MIETQQRLEPRDTELVPQTNVEVVRRMYESGNRAFAADDVNQYVEEFFTPEVVFESGGLEGFGIEGTPRGHEGVRGFYESWMDVMDDIDVEPVEILDAGERVVVPIKISGRMRYTGLNAPEGILFVHVLTLSGGKIARMEMYRDRAEAFASAGLEDATR